MRMTVAIAAALATVAALVVSGDALATTRAQALAMPLGSWPAHLECAKDDNGNQTGYREEEIIVTDAPDQGNVLTRLFPDRTCHG